MEVNPRMQFLFLLLATATIELLPIRAHKNNATSKITLGSSLSADSRKAYWPSHSGNFAFGFYDQGDPDYVAIGIWLAETSPKIIAWTANRDNPPLLGYATQLMLTADGELIIRDAQGAPDVRISGGAASAAMLDSGNFVLYDSNMSVVWQSFDYPTDTLLSGQSLEAGEQLVSAVDSKTDQSTGKFMLNMQPDGNLVLYPFMTTPHRVYLAYWALDVFGTNTLILNSSGILYVRDNETGFNIHTLGVATKRIKPGEVVTYRLTIESDGILRLYSHVWAKNNTTASVEWVSHTNKCAPIGLCGLNSYCVKPLSEDQAADCKCAPGFEFLDASQKKLGCAKTKWSQCGAVSMDISMEEVDDVAWNNTEYSVLSGKDKASCIENCRRDCKCEVVIFEDMQCKKQILPLKYSKRIADAFAVYKVVSPKQLETVTKERLVIIKVKDKSFLIVSIFLTVFGLTVMLCSLSLVWRTNRSGFRKKLSRSELLQLMADEEELALRPFTFGELVTATNGFAERLGRGSFGTVFKGSLQSGSGQRVVAVKRLEKVVEEGEVEFRNEMRSIGRTHHRNLLRLLGYCQEGPNRLLVYEYMSNGSLSDFLFNSSTKPPWSERVKIAVGVARGILYLHEECESQIIHCDINPNNILIDENSNAKIADFGLAKIMMPDQTKTHTGIRGTRGFVAPEWHKNLPVTAKADVYSFGVVLLVIICCRRSVDANVAEEEIVLVDWVIRCLEEKRVSSLTHGEEVNEQELEKLVKIGLWCVQDELVNRPAMKKVVAMFEETTGVPEPPLRFSYANID